MKRGREEPTGEVIDLQLDEGRYPVYIDVDVDPHDRKESCIHQVLQIFPDAELSALASMLRTRTYDATVTSMAFDGYAKSTVSSNLHCSSSFMDSIDFATPSDQWVTVEYKMSAHAALEKAFPYLKLVDFKTLLTRNSNVFWKCFEEAMALLATVLPIDLFSEEPPTVADIYGLYSDQKEALTKVLASSNLHLKQVRPSFAKHSQGNTSNPVLQRERVWHKQLLREKRSQRDLEVDHQLNNKKAEQEGTLVECGCCFEDYAFENLVQCSEGHLFCRECLTRHTEQTLYGNRKSSLGCLNSAGDVCSGFFSDNTLRRALPSKVYGKFAEARCRDVILAAKINDIVSCYNCSGLVELPADAGKLLLCPNCRCVTCRDCGEVAHIPLRCEEVEKKDQTNLRLRVEEAMTKARVRECPKCHQKFYKLDGCNKMTCPCGTKICYLCRANISNVGYGHFCQASLCTHQNCGKCSIQSDCVADDQLAMRDAGLKEIEIATADVVSRVSTAIGADSRRDQDMSLHIDLDKYLHGL